jgi:cytoskeletal protein RodZ
VFEIGNSLREARSRRGIDFAQAELGTKIRGKYLRALEDEQFELLPAQTYVKGFLRTYAEYLGLDGQLYVDEFNSRFATGEASDVHTVRRSNARPQRRARRFETSIVLLSLAAIAVVTVVVISAWKWAGGDSPRATPPAKKTATHHATTKTDTPPLLTVVGIRGSTHVTARRGNATGTIAFDGTIGANDPQSIRGSRLWVQIDAPENLKIMVRGHLVHVPGNAPRVIVVTGSGWRPA